MTCRSRRKCLITVVLVVLCFLPGCGQMNRDRSFGAVTDRDRTSLNGLGVHKRMWQLAGAKCSTPRGLSFRLEKFDTIVMVPQTFDPPGLEARQWLEDWLQRSPGRTVIYFGRDFNAETYYLEELMRVSSGAQRAKLEFELANVRSAELNRRLDSYSESTFCGWFFLDARTPSIEVTEVKGRLADGIDNSSLRWPVRTQLLPPQQDQAGRLPSWLSGQSTTPAGNTPPFVKLKSKNTTTESKKLVSRSYWNIDELSTRELWDKQFVKLPACETLLTSEDGVPLIYRLTSSELYGGGQIIIVVNGVPFLNGTLVKPQFGQLGARIVELANTPKRVALVAYDDSGIQISSFDELDARGLGIEMLVQWPLSAITIPACIAGIIWCISLLPILGRPQQLPTTSTSDFSLHVDALGQMLYDSDDKSFAAAAITDYFHTVRREKPPAWLTSQPQARLDSK